MKKSIVAAVAALLALALCGFALAEAPTLTAQGIGIVRFDADAASIMLGVREVSEDVATAQATVNEKLAKVVTALKEAGVNESDIQTSSISLYPQYDYDQVSSPIVGYSAENMITVTTTEIDSVGRYIDLAFEAGANTFNDISFSALDTSAQKARALELAVENARAKAETIASATGMKLGDIVRIAEGDDMYYGGDISYAKAEEADAAGGTQVYASRLQVSATVTIEYSLVPAE